jgi:hemerythrin-like metal-binding protein
MPQDFKWDDNYDIGIESLNQQHQNFIKIASRLMEMASKDSVNKDELDDMIKELEKYAFYHIDTEETYFAEYKYPDAAAHIADHNRYRETVKLIVKKSGDPEMDVKTLAQECALFSGKWLIKHIQVMDKKYAPFFIEKGIK